MLFFLPSISFGQEMPLQIEIYLKGMPDSTFFYLNDDVSNIDSSFSQSEKISFKYSKKSNQPVGLNIISKDRMQGYVFWVENESIKLEGVFKDLSPLSTSNSITQKEFKEYILLTSPLQDSLSKATVEYRNSISNRKPDTIFYKVRITRFSRLLKEVNIDFFKKYPNSIISTHMLFFEATHKRFSNEEVLTSFKRLSSEQQNSSIGQGILKAIALYQNPVIGRKAPDFTLNDSNGNSVSLSEFKGKNIILIFWASWCGPCLSELPDIIQFYKKYKHSELVIIAVSLDQKKDSWLSAIQKYSIPFINISDLNGWMNEVALIYGVSGVPDNFLIDKKGNLVVRERGLKDIKNSLLNLLE
jgi:peroxiredoxin